MWKRLFEKNDQLLLFYIAVNRFFQLYSFTWLIFETRPFTWSDFYWMDRLTTSIVFFLGVERQESNVTHLLWRYLISGRLAWYQ